MSVTPAQLILSNAVRLSSQILQSQRVIHPLDTTRPTGQVALSDRMDEWQTEYDPAITEYPINSYVSFTPPVGRSDKLLPRHRGPYQVMEILHLYDRESS